MKIKFITLKTEDNFSFPHTFFIYRSRPMISKYKITQLNKVTNYFV